MRDLLEFTVISVLFSINIHSTKTPKTNEIITYNALTQNTIISKNGTNRVSPAPNKNETLTNKDTAHKIRHRLTGA